MSIRIIPRLDIKGPNLVKGINLEGLRVLGKPSDFAKYYYEHGADELLYMDVVASLYERNSLQDIIEQTANEVFIPITVGGGIRSLEDINQVLRKGADKVLINTAAIKNPKLIQEASNYFGSSTIVIAMEVIKQSGNKYMCFTDNGREYTGVDAVEWAQKIQDLGAGELVLTSVDREGTGKGIDLDLIMTISEKLSIPLIVHGGVGKKEDVLEAALACPKIDGFGIASMFHYDFLKEYDVMNKNFEEGNLDFVKKGLHPKGINPTSINSLKLFLSENNIDVRLT
ncbi:imidazole glycerol phosphate synthase subunit HisF [Aquirufa sp. Wall-65K1]